MKNKKLVGNLISLFSVLMIFLFWGILAKIIDSEFLLPSISETLLSLKELLKSGEFYSSLLSTLLRSVVAFLCCFVISFFFAYLSSKSFVLKRLIEPIIAITRALPTIAVVLLLLIWTNSKIAPIIVTSLVVLPTLYTDFVNSFSVIEKSQLEMCKVDKIREIDVLFKVEVPQMLPAIYSIIGAGLSLNLKLMVASEVLSQTANSIGLMLNTSKVYQEIPSMLALVLITVLISVIIEQIFKFLSKKSASYKE